MAPFSFPPPSFLSSFSRTSPSPILFLTVTTVDQGAGQDVSLLLSVLHRKYGQAAFFLDLAKNAPGMPSRSQFYDQTSSVLKQRQQEEVEEGITVALPDVQLRLSSLQLINESETVETSHTSVAF